MLSKLRSKIYSFLRWTEKWTKTDMVYLAKGGFWLTLSKVIGSISAFILAIVYANYLSKDSYATYKYILSIAGLLVIPTLSGLSASLTRSIALGYEGSLYEVLKTKLKWGFLSFGAGLAISGYYFIQKNYILSAGILIVAVFIPLIEALGVYSSYLQGKKLYKKTALFNSIKSIILLASVSVAVLISSNVIILIFVYYTVNFFLKYICYRLTIKADKLNTKTSDDTISFGKHLSLMNVLALIAGQADKFLTWHLLGPTELAIYSFATLPVTQIQSFFKSIPILAFPKIANQDNKAIKKTLPIKILKFSFFISIIVIVYIISAPYLFKIFFPQYLESIKYSQLFSIILLLYPVRLISHTLIAKANKKSLYTIQIISPISKLVLYATLLPAYGLYGLICAYIASLILDAIYQLYFLRKI